jgi:hypothetical protein
MPVRAYFSLALFAAMPVLSQTGASTSGALMQVPPPVSGEAYPAAVASEARSNYLHAGFVINTAYSDNVLVGNSSTPITDVSYSISPTIALDQTTSRLHQTLTYSPGFRFYQHTSALNEMDQNLAVDFQYRFSPHVTAIVSDVFRKSSNVFNQPYSLSGGAISGSTQSPLVPVVAPYANQLSNTANAELTYQFSRNSMIGSSGAFMNLHYPNPDQVPGLYDSNSRGAAGFYSYRLSKDQYLGVTYQYSQFLASSPSAPNDSSLNDAGSETQTHAILMFFTIDLKPSLSLSLSGGPQYYKVSQSPFPALRSWAPAGAVSMGWQGSHTSLAASYLHVVTAGGGLIGAFDSNSANVSARWQLARTWTIGSTASYAITNNVSSSIAQSNPGGHMVSGTVTAQHSISEHLSLGFGYARLHQSYSEIAAVSNAPNTNREYISISYQFGRPLGR